MSQHFYDGQVKRYLTQFMRMMSNFSYMDAKGNIRRVPVRYGDMNRQVAQVINKNSENMIQSAPFIACYIKGIELARDRVQDPTYVGKVNIRERAYDESGNEYLNTQGANYTVERLMPTPFNLKMSADIWCTNVDQKLQLFEQIGVLFNPSLEIQTSSNYVDWTSLSYVELTDFTFSSRQIPQGLEQDIDIMTMQFITPIWITPPAKVKKLGIITKIIASVFEVPTGTSDELRQFSDGQIMEPFSGRESVIVSATTLGNFGLLVMDNTAKLVPPNNSRSPGKTIVDNPSKTGPDANWLSILDRYPGVFTAGLSQIRLKKPDGGEIVGRISLNPTDDYTMMINWDQESIFSDTLIDSSGVLEGQQGFNSGTARGNVDAIVNPQTFNPTGTLPNSEIRYLILEDTVDWRNNDDSIFHGKTNDIVRWNGTSWSTIFTSSNSVGSVYITNLRTDVQYMWDGDSWLKSYDGIYEPLNWRLVL